MKLSTKESIDAAVDKWIESITLNLSSAAGTAYHAGQSHANGYLKAGVSFEVMEQEAIDYAKKYRNQLVNEGTITVTEATAGGFVSKNVTWLGSKSTETKDEIYRIIEEGIAQGKPTGFKQSKAGTYPKGSIAEDLSKVLNIRKSQASTIARTETARSFASGEIERYKRAGVKKMEYLGGPGACEICEPMIGHVFDISDAPKMPIHPNCRCDYRPVAWEDDEPTALPAVKGYVQRVENPFVSYGAELKYVPTPAEITEPVHGTLPKAIYQHTTSKGNEEQNGIARNLKKSIDKLTKEGYEKRLSEIRDGDVFLSDKVLAKTIVKQDGTRVNPKYLSRGVSGSYAKDILLNVKEGDIISDNAFQSWSISKESAYNFVKRENVRVVLVQDYTPGNPGFYVGKASNVPTEEEFVLPRGLMYKVVSVDKDVSFRYGDVNIPYVEIHVSLIK